MSTYVKDLVERVVVTWVEAFAATLIMSAAVTGLNIETVEAAALAGIAAVAALLKGLLAKPIGSTPGPEPDTASLAPGV